MTSEEFKEMLDRYLRGDCTRREEEIILKWYDRIGKANQHKLDKAYKTALEDKLWNRLQGHIRKPAAAGHPARSRRVWPWRKIAAVVLPLALISSLLYLWTGQHAGELRTETPAQQDLPAMIIFANEEAVPREVTLGDSSTVTLSPHSEIRYPRAFTTNVREVYLTGEAFFSVTRDTQRPFLVYANEIVTRVLGTSFTVKAYTGEKEVTVAVRTGKVSVYKRSVQKDTRTEVILSPNQQVVYNIENDRVLKQLVEDPLMLPESKLFVMECDNTPVAEIFDALAENYGVAIHYEEEAVANCFLTTSMTEEGLFERIKIICRAIGAHYEVAGTDVYIESPGCD